MHPHVPRRLGFSAAPEASAPGAGRAPGAAPLTKPGQPTEEEVQMAHGKYVEALKLGDGWR